MFASQMFEWTVALYNVDRGFGDDASYSFIYSSG